MKKIFLLILCGLYYPLCAMDDRNIFDIDSDELEELKAIADSLEDPTKTVQQEEKKSYQRNVSPANIKPVPEEHPVNTSKTSEAPHKKVLKEYVCPGCNGIYLHEGWFKRHLGACKVLQVKQHTL